MKLTENPIFLTQRRLVHRSGVLAPVLIAALTGLILVAGLVVSLTDLSAMHFEAANAAGKLFYGWIVGLEMLVLVFGGSLKIGRVLAEERKAGLWESNCLTPMRPGEIVIGYWLGPPLRESYMAVVLAGAGAIIVLLTGLSPLLWLGTQVLILSSALFFGLLAALAGMAGPKSSRGSQGIGLLGLLLVGPAILGFEGRTVIGFLLPIYPLIDLFRAPGAFSPEFEPPGLYGWAVPPLLLGLALQFAFGLCCWRAATRKTADPGQPLLDRGEALFTFGLLVGTQHALGWRYWLSGNNPDDLTGMAQAGSLLLGCVLLAVASPPPESLRLALLRAGGAPASGLARQSAAGTALWLAGLGAVASAPGMLMAVGENLPRWLLAEVNLLECLLMFALLLQFCRLRFGRRGPGFFALGLFMLCLLPFIVAGVLGNEDFAKCSFLAPGVVALSNYAPNPALLTGVEFGHALVVGLLFVAWRSQWKALLASAEQSNSGIGR